MKNAMYWLLSALFALSLAVTPSVAMAQSQPCLPKNSKDGLARVAVSNYISTANTALALTSAAAITNNPITRQAALSTMILAESTSIIDDGPYIYMSVISDLLVGKGVKATFFVDGENWSCIYGGSENQPCMWDDSAEVAARVDTVAASMNTIAYMLAQVPPVCLF
ncbi:hypothetical protein LXT21_44380 [Myxococcus sp. K38C18041901]|uniref:hypothetical protein n=1 Tax=Myxococcus guangdongensis TaxID=2906760 RepID=UPI0020A820C1|nr:hypothetical protein [Myxococcus guangdongensis]MCP3065828.1 hypothetical protein [Myxococcus guangdongensis]